MSVTGIMSDQTPMPYLLYLLIILPTLECSIRFRVRLEYHERRLSGESDETNVDQERELKSSPSSLEIRCTSFRHHLPPCVRTVYHIEKKASPRPRLSHAVMFVPGPCRQCFLLPTRNEYRRFRGSDPAPEEEASPPPEVRRSAPGSASCHPRGAV